MKVVILAGGLGARMREETEFKPKPMVLIGKCPILWHIMKIYTHYGYTEFLICLGYKGEMIKEYFCNYEFMNHDLTVELGPQKRIRVHGKSDEDGWKVTLVDTGIRAMTGARVKRVQPHITSNPFLLTYGDGVGNVDIGELLRFHRAHGRIATVTGVSPPSRFGELIVQDEQVVEFSEKPQTHGAGLINGGFFVMDQRVFDYLDSDDRCTLEREPLERLARDGQLMVYHHRSFWQCMDTLRDANLLNELWESGKAPWKVWE